MVLDGKRVVGLRSIEKRAGLERVGKQGEIGRGQIIRFRSWVSMSLDIRLCFGFHLTHYRELLTYLSKGSNEMASHGLQEWIITDTHWRK